VQAEWEEHVDDGGDDDAVVPVVEVLGEPGDPRLQRKETERRPHDPSERLDEPDDDPVVN